MREAALKIKHGNLIVVQRVIVKMRYGAIFNVKIIAEKSKYK
jgi:hypothetical protein